MRIGIDLDGVVYDGESFDRDYIVPVLREGEIFHPQEFHLEKRFLNAPRSLVQGAFAKNEDIYLTDYNYLKDYRILSNNVYVATARCNSHDAWSDKMDIVQRTVSDMKALGIENVYFYHDKVQAYKELNLDAMIEDNPHHFMDLIQAGCNAFLVDCEYNRYIQTDRRLKSVFEYFDMFGVKYEKVCR